MSISLLVFVLCLLGQVSLRVVTAQKSNVCPDYDASKIKLVTFDCFAALMAWEDSMLENIAQILPSLSSSQVNKLMKSWESAYGNAAGSVFEEGTTGAFPFSHMVSSALKTILNTMEISVTRAEFAGLVGSWGKLTPWEGTQETLEQLVIANFTIAPLSNGDRFTLSSAMDVFEAPVKFSHIFPSDFPAAGVFKPQAAIYMQATQVGYAIDEILHVAGSPSDGSGARDVGLFSALLHKDPSPGSTEPCFVLKDITELPAVLGL